VGLIMLAGIAVNNGIVMVDTMNRLYQTEGKEREEAIREAGRRRLRPVLMTTLTTSVGMFPLALGIGEGAEGIAPMAVVAIGGLLTSTLLTLLMIPVAYIWMDEAGRRIREVLPSSNIS